MLIIPISTFSPPSHFTTPQVPSYVHVFRFSFATHLVSPGPSVWLWFWNCSLEIHEGTRLKTITHPQTRVHQGCMGPTSAFSNLWLIIDRPSPVQAWWDDVFNTCVMPRREHSTDIFSCLLVLVFFLPLLRCFLSLGGADIMFCRGLSAHLSPVLHTLRSYDFLNTPLSCREKPPRPRLSVISLCLWI